MKEDKVGSYNFVAEPFHVDFTGKLFMSVLGNHLLNCAGFHAEDRGFGMARLNENNYTWVLSRLAIEMNEMPLQFEHFKVETWIESVYRLFTDRNFSITGADGKVYGYARSVWAMINMGTRKPADLLEVHGDALVSYIESDKECPIEKPGRIKVTQQMPVKIYDVNYSDIDINGHVNSVKYIEHILNLFHKDYFSTHSIARFEIAYVAEGYYGDTLSFFKEENDEGVFCVEVRKNISSDDPAGEILCKSRIVFNNK